MLLRGIPIQSEKTLFDQMQRLETLLQERDREIRKLNETCDSLIDLVIELGSRVNNRKITVLFSTPYIIEVD